MAQLSEVRGYVKSWLGRDWTGIDTVVDNAINSAIEMIGRAIPLIYDEQLWEHTFDSDDVTNETDNFPLPVGTEFIRTATIIDPTGDEDVFYDMLVVSPDDAYKTEKYESWHGSSRPAFFTSTRDISASQTFDWNTFRQGGYGTVGRSNRTGRTEFCYRIGNNIYIQPRVDNSYLNWKFRLYLQMYPAQLSEDTDTNTLTNNFPHALAHFATGIVWASRLGDLQRGQAEFTLGAQYLQTIASADQISKLINFATGLRGT